jgi:hypothetical protein
MVYLKQPPLMLREKTITETYEAISTTHAGGGGSRGGSGGSASLTAANTQQLPNKRSLKSFRLIFITFFY